MPYILRDAYGCEYPIGAATWIGREPTNPIVLNDVRASRVHATVWEQQDLLFLRDENSSNGTFVNGARIQQCALRVGDQILIGNTLLVVAYASALVPAYPQPAYPSPVYSSPADLSASRVAPRRRSTFLWVGIVGVLLLAVLSGAVILIASRRSPTPAAQLPAITALPTPPAEGSAEIASSNVPGVQISVGSVPIPAPIAAKDFAALNASLAEKIAVLNQAQLKFIHDMQALARGGRLVGLASPRLRTGSALTDQDLEDIAGKAWDAAILSDQLGELSARQDKGSQQAAQSADQYVAIARTALSLVIDAQSIRTELQNNLIPGSAAIEVIATYGVQLWNASVTDGNIKGNPFTALTKNAEPAQALNPNAAAQVQAQINAGNSSIWIAQSASQTIKTLDVPAAQLLESNPFDPLVMGWLATAEGQSDGNKAQQVAAANLQRLGATTNSADPSKPTQLQVPANSIAVAGGEQIKAGNIPTFKQGAATVVSKNDPNDENAFMQNLRLAGEEQPSDQGKTTVQDVPALVNLSVTNLVIKNVNRLAPAPGSFAEAKVDYSFTLNWSTTLVAPKFSLGCTHVPLQTFTQASGAVTVNTTEYLPLYPGKLYLTCWAMPWNPFASQLGKIDVEVLVGDAAEATRRASRSGTEVANFYGTGTAIAQATLNAPLTQAAATAESMATSDAVATEVYGTQTAEFKLTAAAVKTARAPTATPTPIPGFTLNGTFSINWAHGYYTTGFIKLTVNPLSGKVSGLINGEGTYGGDENCTDGSTKSYTVRREFSGNLVGTVDLRTGALKLNEEEGKMTGTVATSGGCSASTPMGLAPGLALDGTVDLQSHTAKGRIFSTETYDPGEGDWHAGE